MTPTLTIMRGIPGAGKSSEAARLAMTTNAAILGRDNVRLLRYGKLQGLTRDEEDGVTATQHELVTQILRDGRDVIIDEMNVRSKYVTRWIEIARAEAAEWSVVDLTSVPLETCLRQNQMRPITQRVPESVIRDLHRRFVQGQKFPLPVNLPQVGDARATGAIPQYTGDLTKPDAFICDLDGTLAIIGDRSPYAGEQCEVDTPRESLLHLIYLIYQADHHIVFCSGRNEKARAATTQWITRHTGLLEGFDYHLFMRADGDGRKDSIVKLELFWRQIAPRWNVIACFDDRDQVVDAWRSIGLDCYQVERGAF